MTRDIGTSNVTAVESQYLEPVVMVKLELADPAYVHSNVGIIPYEGDDYIGVGTLGSISKLSESEALGPAAITMSLSGLDKTMIATALDSASYKDKVTIYEGYRQDDGTLVADPWIVWSGTIDTTSVEVGPESKIVLALQHDVASLQEINGRRFTDEDQQSEYSGDLFFEHIAEVPFLNLLWAGGPTQTGAVDNGGGGGGRRLYEQR